MLTAKLKQEKKNEEEDFNTVCDIAKKHANIFEGIPSDDCEEILKSVAYEYKITKECIREVEVFILYVLKEASGEYKKKKGMQTVSGGQRTLSSIRGAKPSNA